MQKKNTEKFINILELAFKCSFLIFGLMTFNSYTFARPIMSVIVWTTAGLAGIVFIYRLFNYKRFILNNVVLAILFAFLVSYVISMILNLRYGFITPIKTFFWMVLQYCLLLATDQNRSIDSYRKEITFVSVFYLIYMAVAGLISIIQMFLRYGTVTVINGQYVKSGFVWGRLWGVFTDPNYASVMAVIAILFSLYYIYTCGKKWQKALLWVNIIIQTLYIGFSDSRTGMVVAFIALGFFVYCLMIQKQQKRNLIVKNAICITMAVVVAFAYIGIIQLSKKGFNLLTEIKIENINHMAAEEKQELIIGREQDVNNDISNRRFDLWKSAVETIAEKPVFGLSFNNIVPFVKENLPDTYLINNDHGEFNNYHNVWFNILVGQGIIGFILFILATAVAGIKCIKKLKKHFFESDSLFYIMLFSILIAALASSLFVSDLVYAHSVCMVLFWYFLGIMLKREEAGSEQT